MELIEKIRAEIERLKKDNEISEDKDYAQYELDVACGYDMACDDILSFLDALEEPEKQSSPTIKEPIDGILYAAACGIKNATEKAKVDLEKEIDKFYGVVRKNGKTYDEKDGELCFDPKDDETYEHELRFASHFFNLGKNAK